MASEAKQSHGSSFGRTISPRFARRDVLLDYHGFPVRRGHVQRVHGRALPYNGGMPSKWKRLLLAFMLAMCLGFDGIARANIVEVFANASYAKNYLASDSWTESVSGTVGLAVVLIPHLRLEGRYTNEESLQNLLVLATPSYGFALQNIKTTTAIYSVGLDITFFGDTAAFQPYIYLGGGWVDNERSYYYQEPTTNSMVLAHDPSQAGISANAGIGLRLRIAQSIALELELYGYAENITTSQPLLNINGTAGIRIFI